MDRNQSKKLILGFSFAIPVCFMPNKSLAKGLESLKPHEEMKADNENTPIEEEANGDSSENKTDEPKIPKNLKNSENVKTKEEEAESPPQTSDQLKDKLFLEISIAWSTFSGTEDKWMPGYSTKLGTGWKLFNSNQVDVAIFGTLHYEATDTIVQKNNMQYRGVIESVLPGVQARYRRENFDIDAALNIGYVAAGLTSISEDINEKKPSLNGLESRVHIGARWRFSEQASLGGYIDAGFSAFSSIRPGVNVRLSL